MNTINKALDNMLSVQQKIDQAEADQMQEIILNYVPSKITIEDILSEGYARKLGGALRNKVKSDNTVKQIDMIIADYIVNEGKVKEDLLCAVQDISSIKIKDGEDAKGKPKYRRPTKNMITSVNKINAFLNTNTLKEFNELVDIAKAKSKSKQPLVLSFLERAIADEKLSVKELTMRAMRDFAWDGTEFDEKKAKKVLKSLSQVYFDKDVKAIEGYTEAHFEADVKLAKSS